MQFPDISNEIFSVTLFGITLALRWYALAYIAGILGGTVIVEQIFGLPGLGRYIYDAINNRDYPVVQGVTLVVATMFVLISMLVDVLYAVVDPRLRKS